ncbi:MAG: sodium:calcium antiporter [Phycisphaerales bacterium]|nr:sodium:calcium antiporter [Phycisphaerales bacterium]
MLSLLQDTLATTDPVGLPLASALLVGGLVGLLAGGHLLVEGAGSLARRLGVTPLMVGLTIVAFGTSAPELALNVVAVSASEAGAMLAWGNIIGSNMANVGLVLGMACLIAPLSIKGQALKRDLPLLMITTAGFIALLLLTPHHDGGAGLSRIDGGILLGGFIAITAAWFISGRRHQDESMEVAGGASLEGVRRLGPSLGMVLIGLALLLSGAWAAESGAVDIARHLGVPEVIIGLTIVAVGTSLPEVAMALIGTRRGETDLVIGAVIGSNLFNLVLVMGVTALIRPIPMPADGGISLAAMGLLTVMVLFVLTPPGRLGKVWGMTALLLWAGAITWSALA